MATLTNRDALVVILIGSSNSAGNGSATTGAITRTLPATAGPRTFIWDRWLDTGNRGDFSEPNSSYGFAPLPSDASLLQNVPTPAFALAEQYENRFTGSDRGMVVDSMGTYKGAPGKICFIQFSASSSRATLDAEDVASTASWYPKASNAGATATAYEIFTKLYLTPALAALKEDADIDRIYMDGLYQIGHESAAYAASTIFAFDRTPLQLTSGMAMLQSELARVMKVPANRMPEITVKPSQTFAEFVTADTSRVVDVRTSFDRYADTASHPLAVVDGSLADVYCNNDATDAQLNHYTGAGALQLGEAMFQARVALGVQPVQILASTWEDIEEIA
jgi:hypothetical protein